MSSQMSRDLIAQSVIAGAVCVGGWMMFVQPKVKQCNDLEAKIEQSKSAAADTGPTEEMVRQVSRIRQRAAEITARSALSQDSSALYGMIMDLARTQNVRVESVRPGDVAEQTSGKVPMAVARVEINVEAPYDAVASFLEALDGLDAFLRISTVSLMPLEQDGRRVISGRIVCETISFSLPQAVTAMQDDRHAKQ
jgi:hypothetical protein